MRPRAHPTLLLAAALTAAACSSTGSSSLGPHDGIGVGSRIELVSRDRPADAEAWPDRIVLGDADLRGRRAEVVDDELDDALPAFLRAAETSVTAVWTGERPVLAAEPGSRREVRVRRTLRFDRRDELLATFPGARDEEIASGAAGGFEIVVGELRFELLASEDGSAMRVRLAEVFSRRAEAEVPRVLPLRAKPLPATFSFTLRYVLGDAEVSRTVAFADTIDVTAGDHRSAPQTSDWIALPAGSVPHSLQVSAVATEELDALSKTGAFLFGLTDVVKKAGVL